MKVRDLIEKLKVADPDYKVVTPSVGLHGNLSSLPAMSIDWSDEFRLVYIRNVATVTTEPTLATTR